MSDRLRIGAPAVVLALALARLALGDPFTGRDTQGGGEPVNASPPEATEAARAVLGGLRIGDEVAGFEVTRIGGPDGGEIVVELRDGERGARVWVRRPGGSGSSAPIRAGDHELSYGPPPPGLEAASDERSRAAAEAIRARVEAAGALPIPE